MIYHEKYKKLKKYLKIGNKKVAEITGHTAASVGTTTQPKHKFPRWLKFAIWVHEQHLKEKNGFNEN